MRRANTAEAIADGLIANGIGTVYGLPGVQNDPFFDALFHRRDPLRVIHARHEQGAAYMALGAALATGEPQALSVVPGPGLLNAATALATAYSAHAPVLALVGQIALQQIGRMTGQLHEVRDQSAILSSMTGSHSLIAGPSEVPAALARAFATLRAPRRRPAGIEVPMDVWQRSAPLPAPARIPAPEPPPVDEDAAERAAKLLAEAERPLILIGGGALDAAAELAPLAEALAAPVGAYRMGKGVLPGSHPLAANLPQAHAFWAEADVVLAVGTRLQLPLQAWGTDKALKIIRLDAEAAELDRIAPPALGIVGNAAPVLRAILRHLPRHLRARPGRAEHVAEVKARVAARMREALGPQLDWLAAMREALPEEGVFVDELTQLGYVARLAWDCPAPRRFLSSGYQGTLGYGFATALGAQAALPDRPVLSISGDGGFLFTATELATAVQHGIPLVSVVFDDGAFGNVRLFQKTSYGNRLIASDLRNPSFPKLAEAFGADAPTARSPAELRDALARAFAARRPTVVTVPMGEMPSPWPFIFLPRVRGA
ncbi:MAG: thiamine pyrophosphate-binding protein [Acetobacteraceae bacterium]|nr:thiamine pyrophosphate-binding protein [Acetobacteraceae bacterium]MDW8398682.1 thiamine pyrophosphate-binding protein [Acetobacteraceae bacterium]